MVNRQERKRVVLFNDDKHINAPLKTKKAIFWMASKIDERVIIRPSIEPHTALSQRVNGRPLDKHTMLKMY